MQHVQHHDAREGAVWKWQPVCICHDVNSRKRQDISADNVFPYFLDVGRAASDIENGACRATRQKLLMKITIQQSYCLFAFPNSPVIELTLV